jgi:hypothetical protein
MTPEHKREAKKNWKKNNPDKVRAQRARYAKKKADELKRLKAEGLPLTEWHEKQVARRRRRQAANPAKFKAKKQRGRPGERKLYWQKKIEKFGTPESCNICGVQLTTDKRTGLAVANWDHDHELEDAGFDVTAQFRGWLCGPCNYGIGFLQDRPDVAIKAAQYLHMHEIRRIGLIASQESAPGRLGVRGE